MAFATVPVGHLVFEQGGDCVGRFASSDFGHREFCTRCGTPLLMEVDHEPETLDFSLATLDDPAAVTPAYHIFYASRIGWAAASDGLPTYSEERPKC